MPYDILRHKISITKGEERRKARKELLLKMGAKPPKRAYINYKELMAQKKKDKLIESIAAKNVTKIMRHA
ncbi:unnamed protein product [Protopolystoma xenopodis]|uniref:Uncharacterized protein n=1 Tax=Protopolystoma xenopodis TaxID=117903 RepID=A0A448WN67_9PLAT|nr:unnamed protein product [Protopolystoma xenopodis]